jgi:hypothetical protein
LGGADWLEPRSSFGKPTVTFVNKSVNVTFSQDVPAKGVINVWLSTKQIEHRF